MEEVIGKVIYLNSVIFAGVSMYALPADGVGAVAQQRAAQLHRVLLEERGILETYQLLHYNE